MEKKRTYGVWAVRSSTSIFGPAQSWCKENGKPLEFDSKADAENYAKEANEHTTANVRYYVKEKEPEPGAVRKGTSQPELDARSHEEVIPRNDAAEKQNEIPGRQIPSQTDPLVEIRSAVHASQKPYAVRGKGSTSRMFWMPVRYMIMRSKPRP